MNRATIDFREQVYSPEKIRLRILQKRIEMGLSRKEFAALCSLDYWSVSKKETGEHRWQAEDLIAIGNALHAPTFWPMLDWDLATKVDEWLVSTTVVRRRAHD